MIRTFKYETNTDTIERIANKYGMDYRTLCNYVFKEVGKGKKHRDYCNICNMVLPKTNVMIDYDSQTKHLIAVHTMKEINAYLKECYK